VHWFDVLFCIDDKISYSEASVELKQLYESNVADVPKIQRLLRLTYEGRRQFINGLKNAEVNQILKEFPHLQDIRFVSLVLVRNNFFMLNYMQMLYQLHCRCPEN
jgi:hypothetical protein